MPRTAFLLPLTLRTSPLLAGLLITCLLPSCTLLDLADAPAIAEAAPLPPPDPDFPELGLNRGEETQTGIMSWYSVKTNRGTATASGEKFRNDDDTAAHRTLPFGTYVEVVNLSNNKSAVLRINDRGPFTKGRVIDVSVGAAKKLDFVGRGITQCEVRVLVPAETPPESEEEALSPVELAAGPAATPKPELAGLSWIRPRPAAPGGTVEVTGEETAATAPAPVSSIDGEIESIGSPAEEEPDETAPQFGIDSRLPISAELSDATGTQPAPTSPEVVADQAIAGWLSRLRESPPTIGR